MIHVKIMLASSTSSLVRYLLLISLAAAVVCGSSLLATDTKETNVKTNTNKIDVEANTNKTDVEANTTKSICGIERVTVNVTHEGCEDKAIVVRACNGLCVSGQSTILSPPFNTASCTACQPTKYRRSKMKKLKFMCNGTETVQRVYYPKILECGCINATNSVD